MSSLRASVRRGAGVGGVVLGVAAFTLPLLFGLTRDPRVTASPLVGHRAPEFALPPLDGSHAVSLSDLKSRVVVVNFWASWCLECRQEHEALAAAWARYRDRGVVLVGIPFQDTRSESLRYLAEVGGDWPQLDDGGDRVALDYGVTGVPETVLIAPDGTVAFRWVGPITYEDLSARIDGLLAKEDR